MHSLQMMRKQQKEEKQRASQWLLILTNATGKLRDAVRSLDARAHIKGHVWERGHLQHLGKKLVSCSHGSFFLNCFHSCLPDSTGCRCFCRRRSGDSLRKPPQM